MTAHTAYIAIYWSCVFVAAALIFSGSVPVFALALMVIGWIAGYTFRAILEG